MRGRWSQGPPGVVFTLASGHDRKMALEIVGREKELDVVRVFIGGAAKGAYHGFKDEDPFSQFGAQKAQAFKASLADLQGMLSRMPPDQAEHFKQLICQGIQRL